jgi:hypothetical protein
MKMAEGNSAETSVTLYHYTWRHLPGGFNFYNCHCLESELSTIFLYSAFTTAIVSNLNSLRFFFTALLQLPLSRIWTLYDFFIQRFYNCHCIVTELSTIFLNSAFTTAIVSYLNSLRFFSIALLQLQLSRIWTLYDFSRQCFYNCDCLLSELSTIFLDSDFTTAIVSYLNFLWFF